MTPNQSPVPPPASVSKEGHTPLPWTLYVRAADGSCYLAEGDYRNGIGQAFDVSCDEKTAQRIVAAMNREAHHQRLLDALKNLIFAAENADETGYVTDVGFVDLYKIYAEAHAAIQSAQSAATK